MSAYYNEFDPYAAQWLRNLIAAGLICSGDVDERSIVDVAASDLDGYTQCHFFAGIGVWSHALRSAGWSDERPVWTGSCPCQPFSIAGRKRGADDHRHLWPEFYRLILGRRPHVVFGEQVAGADGRAWLDGVYDDLEDAAYSVGAVTTQAACFGAAHERERLYFVANTEREGRQGLVPNDSIPIGTGSALAEPSDHDAVTRAALDGDFGRLLRCDGTTVSLERSKLHAYGNGLYAPQAAGFIAAAMEVLP